jgi:predicted NBD/HSP70 family sugar kinase
MQPLEQRLLHTTESRRKPPEENQRKGADQHHIREANRFLILNYVREQKTLPRADLARYTGLSRTTIGTIVDALMREGLIQEEAPRSGADRRTVALSFNATAGYVLGCVMGRHHLTMLLSDLTSTPIQRADIPFATSEGPTTGLPHLGQALKAFVAQQQISWEKILGVGLGVIGPLDQSLQRTTVPTPFTGWAGINIQEALEEILGVAVYLDNDGNMGAVGENRYGAGRNVRNLLYVKVGSGIAGGLILNNQLYRGDSGTAGEIGHTPVDLQGTLCHCGHVGCLETVAGSQGILLEAQRLSPTVTTIPQVIEAARAGNTACLHALERAGRYLGFVLSGLVNSMNPSVIVLDGSTMGAGDLVLRPLCSTLEAHSLQVPFAQLQVTLAQSSGLSIALGGVATVLDAIFSNHAA